MGCLMRESRVSCERERAGVSDERESRGVF